MTKIKEWIIEDRIDTLEILVKVCIGAGIIMVLLVSLFLMSENTETEKLIKDHINNNSVHKVCKIITECKKTNTLETKYSCKEMEVWE